MNFETGRHHSRRLARAYATVALAIGLGIASTASADPRYTVSVIDDYAHGRAILAQNYDRAIGKLAARDVGGIKGFFIANNLCVAYLKSGQLDAAQAVCDTAVRKIEGILQAKNARNSDSPTDLAYRRYLAAALSNRGVVFAVNGALRLAREDFAAALETQANVRVAETNLARLEIDEAPSA